MSKTQENKEVTKQDKNLKQSFEHKSTMIWPKTPTLWELHKSLTKAHVKQVREVQYDCKKCNSKQRVTYKYVYFSKQLKDQPNVKSKHLGAFCQKCNNRIRFVRDTPARWVVMNDIYRTKQDAIRTKSGRNDSRKPNKGRRR